MHWIDWILDTLLIGSTVLLTASLLLEYRATRKWKGVGDVMMTYALLFMFVPRHLIHNENITIPIELAGVFILVASVIVRIIEISKKDKGKPKGNY